MFGIKDIVKWRLSRLNSAQQSAGGVGSSAVDANGNNVDVLQFVTNPSALVPLARKLASAVANEVNIACIGDSTTNFDGTNSTPSNDARAEQYGWPAQLRYLLNNHFGTV